MKRFAFTMLEFVFVIIVVGIISVFAIPSFDSNKLAEGIEKMTSHIRYTQHLAMIDDKYNPADINWREENWQIWFRIYQGHYYYEIFSDVDGNGNSDEIEEAIDPLSGEKLGNGVQGIGLPVNSNMNLTEKYGITNMDVLSGNCNMGQGFRIAFDSLGRPYANVTYVPADPYNNIFTVPCVIRITHGDSGKTADITITPTTGYVSVVYN